MWLRVLYLLVCVYSFDVVAQDTTLKLYRPFGPRTPQIKATVFGECFSQSQLIAREDAWRCRAEGKTYDPCFVKSAPNQTEAVCIKSPWAVESIQIKVNYPLNNQQNKFLDMSRTYPWAIELTNGEHCQAIHTNKRYDEMPVRYQCTYTNYLVGHLQRCKAVWSMLEKTPEGVATVLLSKAWF